VHPKPGTAPINVKMDASDIAIGPVHQQHLNGKWCLLSYLSHKQNNINAAVYLPMSCWRSTMQSIISAGGM